MIVSYAQINPEYIKMRWQEPYVTGGLNKRFSGIIPRGIYRGFSLVAGPGDRQVTVKHDDPFGYCGTATYDAGNFDSVSGHNVACYENGQGFQTSIHFNESVSGSVVLDCNGYNNVKLCAVITADYFIGKWTTGQIQLVTTEEVDNNPYYIVMGGVNVPSSGVAITNSHIFYDDETYARTQPWATQKRYGYMAPYHVEQLDTATEDIWNILEVRNIVEGVSGNFDFNYSNNTLSWDCPIRLMVPNQDFDYIIPVQTVSGIYNGDVVYVVLDKTGIITEPIVQKCSNGDLPLDNENKTNYVLGYREGNVFIRRNGEIVASKNIYEESYIVLSDIESGKEITLPGDSENGNALKYYFNGSKELLVWIDGQKQSCDTLEVVNSFEPTEYVSGTGMVRVPDSIDLSYVMREDAFVDSNGNEFSILGEIDNTYGEKSFVIASEQEVSVSGTGSIIRRDYAEFGVKNDYVNSIIIKKFVKKNSILTFRVVPSSVVATNNGGGGGSGTLQETYENGNTIETVSGRPFIVSGPIGEKVAVFDGDIEVTGVIDPTGIAFERMTDEPFESDQDGLWVDSSGNLMYKNKILGTNSQINDQATGITPYLNSTGETLAKGRVARKAGTGKVDYASWASYESSGVIGIFVENISSGNSGKVQENGKVAVGVITASCFTEGVLPSDGTKIFLASNGQFTVTPPETIGQYIVYMGIWNDSALNLQISFLGVVEAEVTQYKVEIHAVTADDITNKYFSLLYSPTEGTISADVLPSQGLIVGTDFTIVSSNRFSWDGLELESFLSVGEKIRVAYCY